jgi:endonuclease YncB( thermonuclease family)
MEQEYLSDNDIAAITATDDHTACFNIKGLFLGKCVKIVDGDTIHLVMKFGGNLQRFTCRLYGYNAAEIHSEDPRELEVAVGAKTYLSNLIYNKLIIVEALGFEKYGRLLANIYLSDDFEKTHMLTTAGAKCIKNIMIESGFGKEYFGKGEKKW